MTWVRCCGTRRRCAARAPTRRCGSDSRAPSMARADGARITAALSLAAVVFGVLRAIRLAWTCDDAYISFRYALHLDHGLGLVYNAGERVEGYSNFLWTLWSALGLELGFTAEGWANAWSIACFGATLSLL